MSRRHDALQRRCPDCGAEPGFACKGGKGVRKAVHHARFGGEKPPPALRVVKGDGAQDHVKALYDELLSCHIESEEYWFGELRKRCESPIEEMLLVALLDICRSRHPYKLSFTKAEWPSGQIPFLGANIFIQANVGPYRADFLIHNKTRNGEFLTVIECDGHNYHERTKSQATRDKRRDRWMTTNGITVLRFTGSEIFHDACAVAEEISEWVGSQ